MTFSRETREEPVHRFSSIRVKGVQRCALTHQFLAMHPQDVANPANAETLACKDVLRLDILAHGDLFVDRFYNGGLLTQLFLHRREAPSGHS
jgi:hypothetical protein